MAQTTLHSDQTDTVDFHEVFSIVEMGLQEFDSYDEAVGEAGIVLGEGARFQVEKTIVIDTVTVVANDDSGAIPVAGSTPVAPPADEVEEPAQAPLESSSGEVASDSPGGDFVVSGGEEAGSNPAPDTDVASPVIPVIDPAKDAAMDPKAPAEELPAPIDTSNAIFDAPTPAGAIPAPIAPPAPAPAPDPADTDEWPVDNSASNASPVVDPSLPQ